jgi:hypothetical protein
MENINDGYGIHFSGSSKATGMTLRDYFAGQALAGVLSTHDKCLESPFKRYRTVAEISYDFADAMIAERNKNA